MLQTAVSDLTERLTNSLAMRQLILVPSIILIIVVVFFFVSDFGSVDEQVEDQTLIDDSSHRSNPLVLQRLAALEESLSIEKLARQRLQRELNQVRQQLNLSQLEISNDSSDTVDEETLSAINSDTSVVMADQVINTRQQALLALGMDTSVMERLKQQEEKLELDQLYLQNRAQREGWFGTRRYYEELNKMEGDSNIYREELGDNRYDQFLFQSGQYNRVAIQSVLSGSQAQQAGLKDGDIIYSYDNKRLFKWDDLTSATTDGELDQPVRIEVLRDNQLVEFYLKRGPLGIRMDRAKVAP